MNKRKYKPCFFCGLKDFVIFPRIDGEYYAECFGCNVRLGKGATEEDAAKNWNDRIRVVENAMYEKYTIGYEQGKQSEREEELL